MTKYDTYLSEMEMLRRELRFVGEISGQTFGKKSRIDRQASEVGSTNRPKRICDAGEV
jgi:hypothetical protein